MGRSRSLPRAGPQGDPAGVDSAAPTPHIRRMPLPLPRVRSRVAAVVRSRVRTAGCRVVALLVLLSPLASCDPDARGATQVKMHDNTFNAPVVRIPAGAGVSFANTGRNPHNIVPVDPTQWPAGFDTSAVAPGGTATLTLTTPGVYEFYCAYHGTRDGLGMAGAVVVGDVPYAGHAKGKVAAVAAASGVTRAVPGRYPTIQAAVDAAAPGDLILVDSGTYREEVTVTTPSLTIRGVDRNAVIIDGEFLRPNGINVLADAVSVENLTARDHTFNGVFWNGVTGYRGRYLTAINNGDYGLYAFDSRDGLLEDSYASGSPDAGFYIGQCDPCDAVIRRVIAEHNTLGYSGTNSSGNLHILSSTWRHNRGGLVPNSLDTELYPPQHGTIIRGNLIHDNNSTTAPGKGLGPLAQGMGVVIGGGRDNVVAENVILDHDGHGVMVAPLIDANWWPATGNVVRDNLILHSGRADISVGGPTGADNCVARQRGSVTLAPRLMECRPLEATGALRGGDPETVRVTPGVERGTWRVFGVQNDLVPALALFFRMWRLDGATFPDWRTQPEPGPQPTMPDARTAPATPAVGVYASLQSELAEAPLPPQADSVLRAAAARPGPTPGTPRIGRVLSWVQAFVPLTPRLLALALAVLIAWRARIAFARTSDDEARRQRRLWRLVGVGGVALWVGLAVATAWSIRAV